MNTRTADLSDGGQPDTAVEVAVPHRRTHRAGEHEGLVISRHEAFEMLAQVSPDDVGEWHGAPACHGLGRTERRPAAELLDQLPVDPDRAQLQVDVAWTKRGQFGPPETREGAQEHQRAVPLIDRVGQGVDLGDGQDRPLCRCLLPSALDPAGVTPDDPVVHGSVEDRLEQPVRLGRGDGAHPGVQELLAPAPHVCLFDFSDRLRGEVRLYVAAEQVAIQTDGLRPEVGPLLDPGRAVVGEQHLARVGIDPVAIEDLGFFANQPDLDIGLGREG